jgi:preprotein translocase subunit Sec61beta
MSLDRISVAGPQSAAGIMGISANTNLGGLKFNPRGVVIFSAAFVLLVMVFDILIKRGVI